MKHALLLLAILFLIGCGGAAQQQGSHLVVLAWQPVIGHSVVAYNVYRGAKSGGPYTLLADRTVSTSYDDEEVTAGATYYYVVTAVNSTGEESKYSNQALAVIP